MADYLLILHTDINKKTMRKITLLFIILMTATGLYSQNEYDDPQNMDINYSREASYPGGTTKLIGDIWKMMEFTDAAIEQKIDVEVMLSFDVNPDSTVSGIILLSKIGYGVDEELLRVFKTLKFLPALAQGKPIKMNVMMSLPIRTGPNSKRKSN